MVFYCRLTVINNQLLLVCIKIVRANSVYHPPPKPRSQARLPSILAPFLHHQTILLSKGCVIWFLRLKPLLSDKMTGVRNLGSASTFTTVFWRYLLNFVSDIDSGYLIYVATWFEGRVVHWVSPDNFYTN
jgi:hypothetical protein